MGRADEVGSALKSAVKSLEISEGTDIDQLRQATAALQRVNEDDFERADDKLILRKLMGDAEKIELGCESLISPQYMKMGIQALHSRWIFNTHRKILRLSESDGFRPSIRLA